MHNSYFFFKHLVPRLSAVLIGSRFISCFSQEKDELILEFNDNTRSFFIRVIFSPILSIMLFPESFRRARKNSADIFQEAMMGKVISLRLFENERSFSISLDNHHDLIFKMHGASGNVILSSGTHHSYFRSALKSEKQEVIHVQDRVIDWSPDYFQAHTEDIEKHYFTFGKEIWQWLHDRGYNKSADLSNHDLVLNALQAMGNPDFYSCHADHKILFSLLPLGESKKLSSDPVDAINHYYQLFIRDHAFLSLKQELIRRQEFRIKNLQTQISKNEMRLNSISDGSDFKEWADMIMANLHQVSTGADRLVSESFYIPGKFHEIRLKPDVSPQKNAEIYYRKSRNRLQEINRVKGWINESSEILKTETERLKKIQDTSEISALKVFEPILSEVREKKEQVKRLPYVEHECMGYLILVGRSSAENDELTFRVASKEDLWLHVRDVSGSHVIIRHKAGHTIPKPVIERAASLAAFHSKRKGETLCPVSFTRRKYVRKRKGDPPGMVIAEREEVIMIEPAS